MPAISFHGDLADIVPKRGAQPGRGAFPRAAKDLIETLGVPHTEIGRITVNGKEAGLLEPVGFDDRIEIYPHVPPRPAPWNERVSAAHGMGAAFIADINVAGLGRLLRILGFDTLFDPGLDDGTIVTIANDERRVILSRDRNLLKRRLARYGTLVRSDRPWLQLEEIVGLWGLAPLCRPFSRCVRCNTLLVAIEKEKVMDQIEPMTCLFYDSFRICPSCGKIFWRGSHTTRILGHLAPILAGDRATHQASE